MTYAFDSNKLKISGLSDCYNKSQVNTQSEIYNRYNLKADVQNGNHNASTTDLLLNQIIYDYVNENYKLHDKVAVPGSTINNVFL